MRTIKQLHFDDRQQLVLSQRECADDETWPVGDHAKDEIRLG
jgi:hypothetical protein